MRRRAKRCSQTARPRRRGRLHSRRCSPRGRGEPPRRRDGRALSADSPSTMPARGKPGPVTGFTAESMPRYSTPMCWARSSHETRTTRHAGAGAGSIVNVSSTWASAARRHVALRRQQTRGRRLHQSAASAAASGARQMVARRRRPHARRRPARERPFYAAIPLKRGGTPERGRGRDHLPRLRQGAVLIGQIIRVNAQDAS